MKIFNKLLYVPFFSLSLFLTSLFSHAQSQV